MSWNCAGGIGSEPRLLAYIVDVTLGGLNPAGRNNARERDANGGGTIEVLGCRLASERRDEVGCEVVAVAGKQVVSRAQESIRCLLCRKRLLLASPSFTREMPAVLL